MSDWQPIFEPRSVADWDATLCDTANGKPQHDTYGDWTGTIDDTALADGNAIALIADGPLKKRSRTELSAYRPDNGGAPVPGDALYEWEVMIPSWVDLSGMERKGSGWATINQFHADQSCYGGGICLDPRNDDLYHRIEGGPILRDDGSCEHEYEQAHKIGRLVRDEFNRIRVEARWTAENDGYALSIVMGREREPNSCMVVHDVPTQGGAGAGQKAASKVMFRLGWYPPFVPSTGLAMYVRNVRVSTR